MSKQVNDVTRCSICGWRVDDTGDHAPHADPLELLEDVCHWCWTARVEANGLDAEEVVMRDRKVR